MKNRRITALVLAAALSFGLTACGGQTTGGAGNADTETGATAAQENAAAGSENGNIGDVDALEEEMVMASATSKDTINIQISSDPGSLDPFTTGGGQSAEIIFFQVCEPLFSYGYNYELVPILAESWEQTDDTHYIFHLRQGVKYSDGKDFTASDVLYSMTMYAQDSQKKQNVKNVDLENTKIIDDYTIEIALTQPDAYFMSCLARCVMIHEETYDAQRFSEKPVGTGPYVVESYIGGNSAALQANENYWQGAPAIKHVNYKVINDVSQRCIELETGGVDVVIEMGQTDYNRIETDDRFHTLIKTGYKSNGLYFNCSENSVFKDVKVRQAAAYAIDSAAIFAATYQNKFGRISTAFPSDGMIDYDSKWEEGGYYTADIEKAKALLSEAGVPEGTVVQIISNEDATLLSNCEIIQAMLSQIGLQAEIVSYEKAVYNSILDDEAGGWDIATNAFSAPSGYAADMAYAYFSWEGINRSCYKNERLEELVTASNKISDEAERKEMTDEIIGIIQDEVPAYAYTRQAVNYAWVKELKGFNIWGQNQLRVQYLYFE